MRILIATDAWHPQVNGVVRTYDRLAAELSKLNVEPVFLSPQDFATVPCPTYPQIRLALPNLKASAAAIRRHAPDAIHIATEGPVGWMARAYCRARLRPYTTSFHTRFPEYLSSRFAIPERWTYGVQRRFHNTGAGTMVATRSLAAELSARGFKRLLPWTRGVDTQLFRPRPVRRFGKAPVFIYVGRVAVEKNLEAFLGLDLPGRKVIVGDGPQLAALRRQFPETLFTGALDGADLAECYASADVFVFPSRTDTFGLVLLEAMASGLPVAAYPVTGPVDLVEPGVSGMLAEDLGEAARGSLSLDRDAVRAHALTFSWTSAARIFLDNIGSAVLREANTRNAATA
jgi:glycosyltransferase involved in cell wall biosynthesis